MRTTLTLDDDILQAASKRAESLKISLGKAVSDLARRGIESSLPVEKVNGLMIFSPPKNAPRITMKKVKEALADFP